METNKNKSLSNNAKESENISKKFTDEIKLAAEAMRRTNRQRNLHVVNPTQHVYKQIF